MPNSQPTKPLADLERSDPALSGSERAPRAYVAALVAGIAAIAVGGQLGLVAWAAVALSTWALTSRSTRSGRWMAWVGLAGGVVYTAMNLYLMGYFGPAKQPEVSNVPTTSITLAETTLAPVTTDGSAGRERAMFEDCIADQRTYAIEDAQIAIAQIDDEIARQWTGLETFAQLNEDSRQQLLASIEQSGVTGPARDFMLATAEKQFLQAWIIFETRVRNTIVQLQRDREEIERTKERRLAELDRAQLGADFGIC